MSTMKSNNDDLNLFKYVIINMSEFIYFIINFFH